MAAINPRIPLTEVTEEQYAALAFKDPHRLYAVPYSGDATASSAGDLQTVLTIRYLLDAIMTDDDTLYCVAQLEPIETLSQDLLTAENGDLLCVRSTAGAVYTTSLEGICLLTRAEYDAITEKSAYTKYIVQDGAVIQEYLGTVLMK